MKKRNEVNDPESTWNRIPDDEPVFILRAQDEIAATVVRLWCVLASERGTPIDKLIEAEGLAESMEYWENRKVPD